MTSPEDGATGAETTFADLQIHPSVLQAVTDVGYETPSAIQAATIPAMLAGSDVVGLAQTGTGKTAAFAIPILSKIDTTSRNTQALVLAPTRELALQVAEAFGRYGAHLPAIQVLPIYGGSSYGPQLAGLRRGAQVVVGTPGRVIDHLEKGSLDLSHLDYLVLDEADEMLQMGFAEDVERILADTPEYKQVALFSATMPPAIKKITSKYLHDPVEVTVKAKTQTAENITQRYLQVSYPRKMDALTRLLEVEEGDAMIVFVRTKQATEEVAEKLRARGFAAAAINGDIPQTQRERTIASLKSGSIDILVATDVAARGLDVERISHVVNYDIPHDPESYVHRIGRTGRAGRSGNAMLFVTPRERHLLNSIERVTRSIAPSRCRSRGVTNRNAVPERPARPVRPIRCTYDSGSCGMSKFTTCEMRSTSSPRAATSVATRMSIEPSLSWAMVRSRTACGMSPLMAAAAKPRARSFSATSSVACLVRTKTIMASPCSTSRRRVSASILRG